MTARRRVGIIVGAICTATILTGCGGSDSDPLVKPTSDATTSAAADPDGFTAEQRAIADRVTTYFTGVAARGTSPVEPVIQDLVTPELLATIVAGEQKNVEGKGLQHLGEATVDVDKVTIEGDTATVEGCYDGSQAYLVKKGEDTPGSGSQVLGYSTMSITMVRSGDNWLISQPLLEPAEGCSS